MWGCCSSIYVSCVVTWVDIFSNSPFSITSWSCAVLNCDNVVLNSLLRIMFEYFVCKEFSVIISFCDFNCLYDKKSEHKSISLTLMKNRLHMKHQRPKWNIGAKNETSVPASCLTPMFLFFIFWIFLPSLVRLLSWSTSYIF